MVCYGMVIGYVIYEYGNMIWYRMVIGYGIGNVMVMGYEDCNRKCYRIWYRMVIGNVIGYGI
jgi:hypothetical protein